MATFAISCSPRLRRLFSAMGLGPRRSRVELDDSTVGVRLGCGFQAWIPRPAVVGAQPYDGRVYGWGAHGWRHRWLVNGSLKGIVAIRLDPPQRGHVLGFLVKLRELAVSVEDRDGLLDALT